MMVCITITWSDCQSAVYPAQLAGTGVAIRRESVLQGPVLTPRIRLLTHRFIGLHLVRTRWRAPLLVLAALFRIQSP